MAKSIIQDTKECWLCRIRAGEAGYYDGLPHTGLHKHHVMFGTGSRKLSEHYGLWVWLCVAHHEYGPEAVHSNRKVRVMLCQEAQRVFEQKYSHEKYMEVFGKNWLDDETPQRKQDSQTAEGEVKFIDTGIGDIPF